MGLPGAPAMVLTENAHLLPRHGSALDLACGLGANSILLAAHGLQTHAWDISPVAVEKLRAIAVERALPLEAEVHDVHQQPLPPVAFDVIVVAHFLERSLAAPLINALNVVGLFFYLTFTRTAVSAKKPKKTKKQQADGE